MRQAAQSVCLSLDLQSRCTGLYQTRSGMIALLGACSSGRSVKSAARAVFWAATLLFSQAAANCQLPAFLRSYQPPGHDLHTLTTPKPPFDFVSNCHNLDSIVQ